jgi:hypothetical protein
LKKPPLLANAVVDLMAFDVFAQENYDKTANSAYWLATLYKLKP